ncbi:adenine phosphoribosyltransferase [Natronogracilivirga saccharolytica]|uniref:Adenine phosphoribosyltransferase n=1 Tax=Natronogracilivirga saccharolytica TaxID=2812953 RepID=A0A8J7UWJ9_9BACT|nr:adenine phosphoribosyltransferase [Natronogracilivirga saccharolytica]MBP3193712.1 adenine phosphoribosyltransferase [Natronogracilivirga saccharolytica]
MTKSRSKDIEVLRGHIRDIPDFPQKGIVFKDITPLLKDPETLILTSRLLLDPFKDEKVDLVAGIESRGFIFGTRLATDLNAGFVPVRKPNKLPAQKISVEYDLEYGTDQLEMHRDAISEGDRVIIHDDLMATGGSAKAAAELIKELGGVVIGYSFILELGFLNGRAKLEREIPVHSLIEI